MLFYANTRIPFIDIEKRMFFFHIQLCISLPQISSLRTQNIEFVTKDILIIHSCHDLIEFCILIP